MDRLHQDGFLVRAWGVSNEELMAQVVEAGVDGMTVNFPDKLTAYLLCHDTNLSTDESTAEEIY